MRLFLRAYKALFYSRGMIIAKIKENVSETLREANYDGLFIVFIRTEFLTKFVNVFGDKVVIQKYINPFGSFALFSPAYRNTVCTQPTYFGKFFNSQSTLFKFTFKVLIIHLTAFNINDIRNYNKKLIKIFGYILDLFPKFIIRLYSKTQIILGKRTTNENVKH